MRLSVPIFRLKRRAKLLSREKNLPLHEALDRVARDEGFQSWSHLAASRSAQSPAAEILSRFGPGDLVLLGARPGHGKTLLGLELAAEAARNGGKSFFFTLEYTPEEVLGRLKSLGTDLQALGTSFSLDTSDGICADHVIERLKDAPGGTVAVIDYLQLLDQKRENPDLTDQVRALRSFARLSGSIILLISQIDRSFEGEAGRLPRMSDVRLPNPLDLTLFTKTCFLHEGELQLEEVA